MRQLHRLTAELDRIKEQGLWRQRTQNEVDDASLLNFCSNDYLGLAQDADLIKAAQAAVARWGVGGQSSQFVSGYSRLQADLEQALADWLQREACLIFSSGFLANVGLLQALLTPACGVVADKLCHASLIDGIRLSQAKWCRYQHLDPASAGRQLKRSQQETGSLWVITESVFSMEGDVAPLKSLSALAQNYEAAMVVDEAHALGLIGPEGRGVAAEQGLTQNDVPVLIGTFGKAFGANGAFVVGPQRVIDYLQQVTRSLIYTTAPPPAVLAAAQVGLDKIRQGDALRQHLQLLIQEFRQQAMALGLPLLPSNTPIQPVMIGSAQRAVAISDGLRAQGFWVQAIRSPTVPVDQARLRCVLNASHSVEQVQALVVALAKVADSNGCLGVG